MQLTEKEVLDLEKKYFEILHTLFTQDEFTEDLISTENYLSDTINYERIKSLYSKKNKIDVGLERIIRKHIYSNQDYLRMVGIYPSPVSADIAFQTDDAIINLDTKTIDSTSNSNDWLTMQFEKNQSSFENNSPGKSDFYAGCDVACHLPKSESGKPILTFFLSLKYTDNNESFEIFRDGEGSSNLHLTVLPNGYLSSLFANNLITNCKTFNYEKDSSGDVEFVADISTISKVKQLKDKGIKNFAKHEFNSFESFKKEVIKTGFVFPKNIEPINIFSRWGFIDKGTQQAWVPVNLLAKRNEIVFKSLLSGGSLRADYADLTSRVDSENNSWKGHIEWTI